MKDVYNRRRQVPLRHKALLCRRGSKRRGGGGRIVCLNYLQRGFLFRGWKFHWDGRDQASRNGGLAKMERGL